MIDNGFTLSALDYVAFAAYFAVLCTIAFLAGRRKRASAEGYFLAGRSLPWCVVGSSFIAANISTEQFIGMEWRSVQILERIEMVWSEACGLRPLGPR